MKDWVRHLLFFGGSFIFLVSGLYFQYQRQCATEYLKNSEMNTTIDNFKYDTGIISLPAYYMAGTTEEIQTVPVMTKAEVIEFIKQIEAAGITIDNEQKQSIIDSVSP